MPETIRGPVLKIIDEKTFLMEVELVGEENYSYYDKIEQVEIDELYPNNNENSYMKSKENLKELIEGKNVRCYINSRNENGTLKANIKILSFFSLV